MTVRGYGLGSPRNGLPVGKGYVYRGGDTYTGPRATGLRARIAQLDPGGPDAPDELGFEHRREQLVEDGQPSDPPAHVIPCVTIQAAWPPAPASEPPPATPAERCGVCRYLTTSIGHRVNCGD